jgi:hypothetical protein
MSVTVNDIFTNARALLDEYSDSGSVIPEVDVEDFLLRAIKYADMAQKELIGLGNFYKTYEFSRKPIENLIGERFEKKYFTGTTVYIPNSSGIDDVKSYYVEADGTHTIEIQQYSGGSWSTVATHTDTTTKMTAYKDNLDTTGLKTRIKLSGSNFYQYQNVAMFEYSFDTVPDYKPWVKYTMPSDFDSVESLIILSDKIYVEAIDYKWENYKDLYVSYNFDGTVRINYKAFPTTLTSKTDILEISDSAATIIAYYVAARIATSEQQNLVNYFEQKYNELKMELRYNKPAREQEIQNVY